MINPTIKELDLDCRLYNRIIKKVTTVSKRLGKLIVRKVWKQMTPIDDSYRVK